jgi:hypothetical protein
MKIEEQFGQTGVEPRSADAGRSRLERAATAALAGSVASAIHRGQSYGFAPSAEILADETRAAALVDHSRLARLSNGVVPSIAYASHS